MEDVISRQAAIDAMCELMHHWFGGDPKDEIREIKRELENLPSAQPERKNEKWIPETEDWRNQIVWVKCSECGFDTSTSYNYCPNCGCRMDGGEQDE